MTDRLIPEGADALDDLTIGELDFISRQLKCDVHDAVNGEGAAGTRRFASWAHLAHVWAKRTDPSAKLQTYLDMKARELGRLLGVIADPDESPDPTTGQDDATGSA